MVNINLASTDDDSKATMTEKVEVACKYGQIDGNFIRLYHNGGEFSGRINANSVVTVYAGKRQSPINVKIGCKVWEPSRQEYITKRVYTSNAMPAPMAVEHFLESVDKQQRLIDFSFADKWHCDIEVLPGRRIIDAVAIAVDVLNGDDPVSVAMAAGSRVGELQNA